MDIRVVSGTGADAVSEAGSVAAVFRRQAAANPQRDAVAFVADPGSVDGAHLWSYETLDLQARVVAAWLRARYLPGSRVLLLYPVGLEFVAAFLGCLYAGIVAVPAPLPGQYRHHRNRLRVIATDAGVSALLTDRAHQATVEEWASTEGLRVGTVATGSTKLADPDEGGPVASDWETLALLQYTSGSTGHPKGVMLDHGNLLHNVSSFVREARWEAHARSGGWIPLHHDMGLSAQLLPALLRGGACFLMEPMAFARRPGDWLRLIDRFDLSVSLAPNFAYDLCTRRVSEEQLGQLDLSRWTFAGNGSEPVRPGVMAAFAKRFSSAGFRDEAFATCYGLAEATVFVTVRGHRPPLVRRVEAAALEGGELVPAEPGQPARSLVSCGPVDYFDLRIVDPGTGQVLPDGRVGEIWLRGRSVGRGYWNNDVATRATFRASTADGEGGYLRTGDLGAVQDGELYVCGRIKDMIIMRGRNLYPHDIEHELRAQHRELGNTGAVFTVPASASASASGDADADADEQLIVTHEVGNVEDERLPALAANMAQTVAREFGAPVTTVLLLRPGAVSRTTSGKIQRSAMRDLFLAGQLHPRYPTVI